MISLIKKIAGTVLLAVVVVLPYRWRVGCSDVLGLGLNRIYAAYVGGLRWLFRKIEE